MSANSELLKLTIGDTDTTTPMFTEEQYEAFLTAAGQVIDLAAYKAVVALITSTSLKSSIGIGSYSQSANLDALNKMLEEIKARLAEAGLTITGVDQGFDAVAEIGYTPFTQQEIVLKRQRGF